MDWDAAKFGLDALQVGALAGIGVYTWWTSRTRATRAAIDRVDAAARERHTELAARVDAVERRQSLIEQRQEHTPTHDDIGKIYDRLNAINESVRSMSGEFKAVQATTQMIHEYLLNEGGRR